MSRIMKTMALFTVLLIAAVLTTVVLWVSGRPVGPNRVSAVLWKTPSSFNNIRPWIEPRGETPAPEDGLRP